MIYVFGVFKSRVLHYMYCISRDLNKKNHSIFFHIQFLFMEACVHALPIFQSCKIRAYFAYQPGIIMLCSFCLYSTKMVRCLAFNLGEAISPPVFWNWPPKPHQSFHLSLSLSHGLFV